MQAGIEGNNIKDFGHKILKLDNLQYTFRDNIVKQAKTFEIMIKELRYLEDIGSNLEKTESKLLKKHVFKRRNQNGLSKRDQKLYDRFMGKPGLKKRKQKPTQINYDQYGNMYPYQQQHPEQQVVSQEYITPVNLDVSGPYDMIPVNPAGQYSMPVTQYLDQSMYNAYPPQQQVSFENF